MWNIKLGIVFLQNNDMTYWKKFVSEYYAPCAKQRLCFSTCDNVGQQALNLFTEAALVSPYRLRILFDANMAGNSDTN